MRVLFLSSDTGITNTACSERRNCCTTSRPTWHTLLLPKTSSLYNSTKRERLHPLTRLHHVRSRPALGAKASGALGHSQCLVTCHGTALEQSLCWFQNLVCQITLSAAHKQKGACNYPATWFMTTTNHTWKSRYLYPAVRRSQFMTFRYPTACCGWRNNRHLRLCYVQVTFQSWNFMLIWKHFHFLPVISRLLRNLQVTVTQ